MAFGDAVAQTVLGKPIAPVDTDNAPHSTFARAAERNAAVWSVKVTDELQSAAGAFGFGNIDYLRHECEC